MCIRDRNEDGGKRKNAARRRELEAAQKRIGELNGIFKRLYEDSVSGRITDCLLYTSWRKSWRPKAAARSAPARDLLPVVPR